MANAAGESNGETLRLDFDRRLMLYRGPDGAALVLELAYRLIVVLLPKSRVRAYR
jgi:hypothetical protein